MLRKNFVYTLCSICFICSCAKQESFKDPLAKILSSQGMNIKMVIENPETYEVQIRYTQIDRKNDSIRFTDYDFRVNDSTYFYPASTVKFPAAVLTLEKLNSIDSLNKNTRFYVEGDSIETTFAKSISAIFAISDNGANNRLIEFLGQDYLNNRLKENGISPVRISHRLGYHSDDLATKPLIIYQNDSTTTTLEGSFNTTPKSLRLKGIEKGTGYYDEDSLIEEPFDFGLKNYYPISAQHQLLKKVIFPEQFKKDEQFNISDAQHQFLLNAMHTLPKNSGFNSKEYYDSYGKFFIYGDTKDNIPDYIKIYNKVGYAYGTLTDCAYIKDFKNDVDFLLTATILVNKNGIFNDDDYEYDEIGIPFLAALGREVYNYELKRK